MGAWNVTSFGNDDAIDWLDRLIGGDSNFLLQTLTAVADLPESEYLERDEAAYAIAAAEIVAVAIGFPPRQDFPALAATWLKTTGIEVGPELRKVAQKSVDRVKRNSELQEVRDDSPSKQEWYADVDELLRRLG